MTHSPSPAVRVAFAVLVAVAGWGGAARAADEPTPEARAALFKSSFEEATARGQWEGALRAIRQRPADERPVLYRGSVLKLLDEARAPDRSVRRAELAAYLVRHVLEDLPADETVGATLRTDLETRVLALVGEDDAIADLLVAELLTDPTDGRRPGHDRLLEVARSRIEDPTSPRGVVESAIRSLAREGRGAGGPRVPDVTAILARRWRAPVGPRPDPVVWRDALGVLFDVGFPDADSVAAFFEAGAPTSDLMRRLDTFAGWDSWTEVERVRLDRDLRAHAAWLASRRPAAECLPDGHWSRALSWATELIRRAPGPAALLPFLGPDIATLPRSDALQLEAVDRIRKLLTPNGTSAAPVGREVEKEWRTLFAAAIQNVVDPAATERILNLLDALKLSPPEAGSTDVAPELADTLIARIVRRPTSDNHAARRTMIYLVPRFGGLRHGQALIQHATRALEQAGSDDAARTDARGILTSAIESLPMFQGVEVAHLAALLPGADADVRRSVVVALRKERLSTGPAAEGAAALLKALVFGVPAGSAAPIDGVPFPDPEHVVREQALRSLDSFPQPGSSAALAAAVLSPPADAAKGRAEEADLAVELLGRQVRVGPKSAAGKPAAQRLIDILAASTEGEHFVGRVRTSVVAALAAGLAELSAEQAGALGRALVTLLAEATPEAMALGAAAGDLAARLGQLELCSVMFERSRGAEGEQAAAWSARVANGLAAHIANGPAESRADRDRAVSAWLAGRGGAEADQLELLRRIGDGRGPATWELTSTLAARLARADPAPDLATQQRLLGEALDAEGRLPAPTARAIVRADLRLDAARLAGENGEAAREVEHLKAALVDALSAKDAGLARRVAARVPRLRELVAADEFAALQADITRLEALAGA